MLNANGCSTAGLDNAAEFDKLMGGLGKALGVQMVTEPYLGESVLVDIGREINGSRIFPGVIVKTWGGLVVNIKAFVDGVDNLWVTSVAHKSQIAPPVTFAQERPVYWFRRYEGAPLA